MLCLLRPPPRLAQHEESRRASARRPWRGDGGGACDEGDAGGGVRVLRRVPLLHLRRGAPGAAVLGGGAGVGGHGAVVGDPARRGGAAPRRVRRGRVPTFPVLRAARGQAVPDRLHVRRHAAVRAHLLAPRQGLRRRHAPGRRRRRAPAAAAARRRRRQAPAVRGRGARVPGGGGDAPAQRVPHAVRQRGRVLAAAAGVRRRRPAGPHLPLLDAGAVGRRRHRLLAGGRRGHRGVQPRRGRGRHGARVRGPRRGAQGLRGHPGAGVHGAGARAAHQPRHGGGRGAVRTPRRRAAAEGRRQARAGRRWRGLLDRLHPCDLRRAGDHRQLHVLQELQEE